MIVFDVVNIELYFCLHFFINRVNLKTMLEIKQLPKSEIEITGEIAGEEFSKFWPKAIAELSKDVSLRGFRPGHVPEKVLIDKVGEGEVLEKSAELALQDIYPKIVQEKKLEVIGPPRASITKITKNGPLGFKFQTAVLPKIKLIENYKEVVQEVFKKKEEVKVEEKEVEDSIEYLKKVKEKQPDNKNLPEINEELKDTIRKNLQTEKEFKMKEQKRLQALDEILKKSEMEVPDVLIESEKNKMLSELKFNIQNMGLKWEDYLRHVKKEEQEILNGWVDEALRRVKYGLLLRQLADELKIEVTEKEMLDSDYPKDYAYGIIRNNKVFKSLES